MKKIFDMTEKLLLYFASICLAVFSVSTGCTSRFWDAGCLV